MIYFLGYTLKSFRGGFTSLVDHLPDSLAKRGGAKSQSSLGTFQIPETMNVGLTIVLSQEAGESQGTWYDPMRNSFTYGVGSNPTHAEKPLPATQSSQRHEGSFDGGRLLVDG